MVRTNLVQPSAQLALSPARLWLGDKNSNKLKLIDVFIRGFKGVFIDKILGW